jgi:hypothetical protein
VVALGPGMFGITTGTGLAQRGLDLLLDNKINPDHKFFQRQSGWNIISSFLISPKTSVEHDFRPYSKGPRVIQLGKRGAMTGVLHQTLARSHDIAVYGARDVDFVIRDIQTRPGAILLVASHGMQAKLPAHYDKDYVSANQAIEKVLMQAPCQNLLGFIVISGGIPRNILQELIRLASSRRVRFVHLPGLATSMAVLLNAVRSLLPNIENPTRIIIEDTFHKAKREIPSAGGSQLLAYVVKCFGTDRLIILVSDSSLQAELTSQYPGATIKVARNDNDIQNISHQFPDLITVVSRSYRLDVPYHYQHRLTMQGNMFTITFDQSVTNRAQLIPPIHQVIQKFASLPPGFSCTNISSVLPVITFEPRSSFTEGLTGIIMSLQNANAILSIQTRQAEPDQWIREQLTGSSGQIIRSKHVPSLSCCMRINAAIDAQSFSLSLSKTTTY